MASCSPNSKSNRPGRRNPRAVRSVRPADHQPPAKMRKAADSLVCDHCGVVQHGGRWYWGAPALGPVRAGLCPACTCIRDRHPKGTLRIPMAIVGSSNELMQIVTATADDEKRQHALERLIDVVERRGELVVTTTGMHLVRRLVTRLQRHLRGKPVVHYAEDGAVAATWPAVAPRAGGSRSRRGSRAADGGTS